MRIKGMTVAQLLKETTLLAIDAAKQTAIFTKSVEEDKPDFKALALSLDIGYKMNINNAACVEMSAELALSDGQVLQNFKVGAFVSYHRKKGGPHDKVAHKVLGHPWTKMDGKRLIDIDKHVGAVEVKQLKELKLDTQGNPILPVNPPVK